MVIVPQTVPDIESGSNSTSTVPRTMSTAVPRWWKVRHIISKCISLLFSIADEDVIFAKETSTNYLVNTYHHYC